MSQTPTARGSAGETTSLVPASQGVSFAAATEEIVNWLRMHAGDPFMAHVLEQGRPYEPRPIPDRRWRRPAGGCLMNAQRAALRHGWEYVEGFALRSSGIGPEGHAWNIDEATQVVDTTWDTAWGYPVLAYYGVTIPYHEWSEVAFSRGYHGGEPILEARFPLPVALVEERLRRRVRDRTGF